MKLTPRLALLLTAPPLLWACNAVLGRHVAPLISAASFNALRWALAFVLLVPLARTLWSSPQTLRAHWKYFAALGFIGMGCYNLLQYQALHSSTALNVTLIASSMPAWMMAVGALVYGVRPPRRELIGTVLSLAGVSLVLGQGNWQRLLDVHFVTGDLLMLLAIFLWAIYSWMLVRPPFAGKRPNWDWAGALMAQLVFGGSFAALFGGAEWLAGAAYAQWSPTLVAALVFVAVGPSLIAYRCWGLGVAEAGPAMAAFFFNLTPAFAAVLSAALLGEGPKPYHGAAFALIVAGIVVAKKKA